MPRKPKLKKEELIVVVAGVPITVILHPPTGARKSWYAYWNGLTTSKSTGHADYAGAVQAVEDMLRNGGKRSSRSDPILSNAEFEEIQRRHFSKRIDPRAQVRAAKSLKECLDAISAFREISGLPSIVAATADDCEQFQRKALQLPKNWRKKYPKSKEQVEQLSANTVVKWSRQLQAAFDRANVNAGKKCVRGVVDSQRLLSENPWRQFTWIEGKKSPIRQFDAEELISFIDFLEAKWPGVSVSSAIAKVCLWSWSRRLEVMSLQWSALRLIGSEYHFEVEGKWGVEKWFRIPETLAQELLRIRTESDFVFAAHSQQLRAFHEQSSRAWRARRVASVFRPVNLGDWFHDQVVEWSLSRPKGRATPHVFRKTALQYARRGEDVNRQVAADARLSENVMMTNYVKETDEEMRQRSNRTFIRILGSLSPEVARRYGYDMPADAELEANLKAAVAAKNWPLVQTLSQRLVHQEQPTGA